MLIILLLGVTTWRCCIVLSNPANHSPMKAKEDNSKSLDNEYYVISQHCKIREHKKVFKHHKISEKSQISEHAK